MKRFLLLTAILSVFALSGHAQRFGFGVKAGSYFSSTPDVPGTKQRIGVVAGLLADYMITSTRSVETGFNYTQRGWNQDTQNGKLKTRLDYIYMPVMFKFFMTSGLNVQLGAQFGYLANGKTVYQGSDTKINHLMNKYDVDFVAGLAYEFDFGLIVEGRYMIGLVDVMNQTGAAKTRINGLQATLGWRF